MGLRLTQGIVVGSASGQVRQRRADVRGWLGDNRFNDSTYTPPTSKTPSSAKCVARRWARRSTSGSLGPWTHEGPLKSRCVSFVAVPPSTYDGYHGKLTRQGRVVSLSPPKPTHSCLRPTPKSTSRPNCATPPSKPPTRTFQTRHQARIQRARLCTREHVSFCFPPPC
ncbi:hypothetical protein FIBSPDRAFT_175720 [Athelia psychrophila]|uniref:Uncharacterized protein n=1 Tax=Athelia psychrophila TaxID=1759441 RepID=A0A166AL17_9AGAM|nr:hypothetical protein FIBSPDRAFT_175720 [Fibularhizoctonia sp. CBS 109695]